MKNISTKPLFLFYLLIISLTFFSCKKEKLEEEDKKTETPTPITDGEKIKCNGSESLCDKRYDEVTYVTTHNAFNYAEGGNVNYTFPNQQYTITRQMQDGVRALMLDVYDVNGQATLYHGFQITGSEPFVNNLYEIRNFLRDNPHEIITVILECYVPFSMIKDEILTAGLYTYLYTKKPNEDWATLGEMIKTNKRLVIMSDENDADKEDWYHYMWHHAVETPFSINDVSEFDCSLNRGNINNDLFIINHFATTEIGTGDLNRSRQANAAPFLLDRALQCEQEVGKRVNFLTVDFYAEGSVFEAAEFLNNRE